MGKWVKALYDILLDRTEPAEMLEKDSVCAVEEVVENCVVLQRQDGSSCMVDRIDFERGFEALNEKLME